MNPKQCAVLIVAIALFSLSELFPPWLYEDGWDSAERSAGYHFILSPPPKVRPYAEMKRIFSIPDSDPRHGFTVREDLARLYGQRLSVLFFMLGFLLVLDDRKSYLKIVFGRIFLLIGFGFVGLYIIYLLRY